MGRTLAGFVASLALFTSASAASCNTKTLTDSVPTDSNVTLKSFSYCGGTLNASAYVANLAYNKVVTLFYTNGTGQSTPLSSVGLNYDSSISNTTYELWTTSTPVYYNGIQELLNITYQVTDLNEVYSQQLNEAVVASGAPVPTVPSPPKPYATPKGFGDDITDWLSNSLNGSELKAAFTRMFVNIDPAVNGSVPGVVVAGRSGPTFPSHVVDYEYNWVRDSSLTFDVVQMLYNGSSKAGPKSQYENALFQYATARATEQNDPNLKTGLGEPKFYLNNTIFSGPWGRPQNDGPATSAITLMEFAKDYLSKGGNKSAVVEKVYDSTTYPTTAPVKKDLLFVARNWSSPSYDLWEEEESTHFYTRMVQRRALVMGVKFATEMNDSSTASTLQTAVDGISREMSEFWDAGRQIVLYEYGPVLHGKSSYLDSAVPLGVIHGYAGDGFFSYTKDELLSTIVRLATSFIDVYPLFNNTQKTVDNHTLGIPIGRYPEDVYNGSSTETNGGNPWYLTTAAMAQYMYAASAEYTAAGNVSVTNTSKVFFDYFTPDAGAQVGWTYKSGSSQFRSIIASLNGWGDAFLRTVKQYTPSDGSLTEEYNRNTGAPQGCVDLTWSYASILTAAFQRDRTRKGDDTTYVRGLANLGYTPNS